MSAENGEGQKRSLDWKWLLIGGVMVALVGSVIVISTALLSGNLNGIPSLGGTLAPTQPVNGSVINVTQEIAGFWEALVMLPYGGSDAPTLAPGAPPAFPPITVHETFGVSGQLCVVNTGSLPTEGMHMQGDLQYKEPSGLFHNMTGIRFEYYATDPLGPGEGRCYQYRMEFLPVVGAAYRIRAEVTVQNAAGWLPGSKNCPGEDNCPTGPRVETDFSLPKEPSTRTEITATPFFPTATVTITSTPTHGPTYTQLPTSTSTLTPTVTLTRTITSTSTSTATATATFTLTPTPTVKSTSTSTATISPTPSPTSTSTPTSTTTAISTTTTTPTATNTSTPTVSVTAS